jgi:hypothetical protein
MMVELNIGGFAKRLCDRRAHREIGHKMPIHDVDVNHLGAGALHRAYLVSQSREVRR